jgi:hypothetical protein
MLCYVHCWYIYCRTPVLRAVAVLAAVYDVTRRETLESLSGSWMAELESYQPHPHVARMVVANKVDAVRGYEGRRGAIVLNLCTVSVCTVPVARMVVANKVDAVRREVDGPPLPAKVPDGLPML